MPEIVFEIISNTTYSISVGYTSFNLNDPAIATIGDTYIGEHHLDNLIAVNGAAVQTQDDMYMSNIDTIGGTVDAANFFQQGKLENQKVPTKYARLIIKPVKPETKKSKGKAEKAKTKLATVKLGKEKIESLNLVKKIETNKQLTEMELETTLVKNNEDKMETEALIETMFEKDYTETEISNLPLTMLASLSPLSMELNSIVTDTVISYAISDEPLTTNDQLLITNKEEVNQEAKFVEDQPTKEETQKPFDSKTEKIFVDVYPQYEYAPNSNSFNKTTDVTDEKTEMLDEKIEDKTLQPSTVNLKSVQSGGVDPQYTYDLNGNRTSMITPFGTWTYTYDSLNRLTSITNPNGEISTISYDALSRRTSMTHDNGVVTSYTADVLSSGRTKRVLCNV